MNVYELTTSLYLPGSGRSYNWTSYKVRAESMDHAVRKVKKGFQRGERVEESKLLVTELDA
jgi:hypothetical protein